MKELRTGFIYIGISKDSFDLAVPYPSVGGAAFEAAAEYQTERNSNGVTVRQRISAPIIKQEISWERIGADQWYEIARFFDENGDAFWCRYFDYTTGEWREKRFVKGAMKCSPMRVDPKTGKPDYFTDAGFSIESIGD